MCKAASVNKEVKAAVWEDFSLVLSSDVFEIQFPFTLNANNFGEHFKDFFGSKWSSKNKGIFKGIDELRKSLLEEPLNFKVPKDVSVLEHVVALSSRAKKAIDPHFSTLPTCQVSRKDKRIADLEAEVARLKAREEKIDTFFKPISDAEFTAQNFRSAWEGTHEHNRILQQRNDRLQKRMEELTLKLPQSWNANPERKKSFLSIMHSLAREFSIPSARLPGVAAETYLMWCGDVPTADFIPSESACRLGMADFDQLEKDRQLILLRCAEFIATSSDDSWKNGREYHVMRAAFYITDTDTTHEVLLGVRILPRKDAQTAANANVDIFTSNDLDVKKEVGNKTDSGHNSPEKVLSFWSCDCSYDWCCYYVSLWL